MQFLHLSVKFLSTDFSEGFFFLLCTKNNLNNELQNIRRFASNIGFSMEQINKLFMNIANNQKPDHKFDFRKYKSFIPSNVIQAFFIPSSPDS